MEKTSNRILILVIVLIIISGVLLFIFRTETLDIFSSEITMNNEVSENIDHEIKITNDILDVEILKLPTFVSLKNNVVDFSFEDICKESSNNIKPVGVIINGGEENMPQANNKVIKCVLGNNFPFLSERK